MCECMGGWESEGGKGGGSRSRSRGTKMRRQTGRQDSKPRRQLWTNGVASETQETCGRGGDACSSGAAELGWLG